MNDLITCPHCEEVTDIGGLIGEHTNDCPRCGRPAVAKPLEWQPLWDAMEAEPNVWIPTTEKMFWEMLECVPPRAQTRRAFLVGEALHDNGEGYPVYSCFKRMGDEYHAKNMTLAEFKEITAWEKTT